MKKTFLIISLLTFSFCSSQDMATDSQENWCLGKANLIKSSTVNSRFRSSIADGTKAEVGQSYSYFITALEVLEERIDESTDENFNVNTLIGRGSIEDYMETYVNALNSDGEEYKYASQLCKIWEEISY
jgi:hypothetical protein